MSDDFDDEISGLSGGTLIKSFGEFWSREGVDWDARNMPGERRKTKKTNRNPTARAKDCNAWYQRGIYALYRDFNLVYVGLANSSEGIGGRLFAHHTKPRLHRRWDSFSWFSIDGFGVDGQPVLYETVEIDAATIARTLELVTILIAHPPLNRSEGRFKDAEKVIQGKLRREKNSTQDLLEQMKVLLDTAMRSRG